MNSTFQASVSLNTKGQGFVPNPDGGEDIMIDTPYMNRALHGDVVKVGVLVAEEGKQIKGEVLEIISRSKNNYVGTIQENAEGCILKADDKRMYAPIILAKDECKKAKAGQKVYVSLVDWKEGQIGPTGKIITVLGNKGEHNVEMQSIILEKGFELAFPEEIETEAKNLKSKWFPVPAEEIARRRDCREDDVFTIDPIDAKDFDDALHIKKLPNGNFEVGVHIADVSNYVTPGSLLDKEAQKRATSVYLVDRTIPMLPEVLSNDLCSLNPNEDRLTFSAIFEMTPNAIVMNRWFGKTIIRSHKRFNYEEAQGVLDAGSGTYFEELDTLNKMAKIMAERNTKAGTINFEKEEIKFELDITGKPIRVIKKKSQDTNKLIEEFMLLANREVAEYIYTKNEDLGINAGLMYRIHDVPNREKILQLAIFLHALGYSLPIAEDGTVSAQDINALLNQVEGKAEEALVKTATVRTMSKAIYSTENTGHFGLAFRFYTHFTSPIRRYPDLIVHRLLQKFLTGQEITDRDSLFNEEMAKNSSAREIQASEAERDSIKYKQIEYMSSHIGEEFEGVISGVAKWGIYVMDEATQAEGMVHVSKIGNDFFTLDEKSYAIVGEKSKKRYMLGDRIRVKIEKIDLDKRVMDLSPVLEKK